MPDGFTSAIEKHERSSAELRSDLWSGGSLRVYASGWSEFALWCVTNRRSDLPASPADVADHLAELSRTRKFATVAARLVAIAHKHQVAGEPFDSRAEIIRTTMRGIARTVGTKSKGKDATTIDEIRSMVALIPETLRGKRDRALILIGFAGAFRRSELVALDVSALDFARDGVIVTLERSKTDQTGEGRLVAIAWGKKPATCPVRALKAWLTAAEIVTGPIFRPVEAGIVLPTRYYDRGVANAVKRAAKRAGLDPAKFAGHSLRAGHITQATENGAQPLDVMQQSGHKRIETMAGYIRRGNLFKNNSSAALGL